ncbi:MAG: hypothetical protein R3A13_06515 [Bdellovibrionota bacterium]
MSKKDLTSVDDKEQGTGTAAKSFPDRRESSEADDDPRWTAEGRPRTGANDMSTIQDLLNQRRGPIDYILIFFGYILPILTVLGASLYFLVR